MSEIYTELLTWAKEKIPAWRQDVLRRICMGETLDDTAKAEVLAMLKHHHGVVGIPPLEQEPRPFSTDHFPGEALGGSRVSLTAIHSLKQVGQMPESEKLSFASAGLTIVYGNNGAGKSGYARVLKQACRARTPGKVYANAYTKGFAGLTPEACIDFDVDGQSDQEQWSGKAGHVSKIALRAVPVFDSECAKHYLQSKESPSFQPSALTALQRLGSEVAQWLKPALNAELSALPVDTGAFDVIPQVTAVGRVLFPIRATTDVEALAKLGHLSDEERQVLATLPQDIAAADPTEKAAGLDVAAARVDDLAAAIKKALALVSDERVRAIEAAHRELMDAETAEREAAKLLSAEERGPLLPGTGQGLWVTMLRAARAFSVSDAYPNQAFPVVNDGAHCVLCQQALSPDAAKRLGRFDAFIRQEVSAWAQRARDAWAQTLVAVANADVAFKFPRNMADSLEKRDAALPEMVTVLQEAMTTRLAQLKAAMHTADWSGLASLPPSPEEKLTSIGKALSEQAVGLRATLDPARLAAMKARLVELQARHDVGARIDALRTLVTNMAKVEGLNRCIADVAATTPVTRCATTLAKKYVSDALAESMQAELERLDLYHLHVGLSSSGDVGAVKVGVQLNETSLAPSVVLSEAEQKMCALAYFFAELAQSGSTSGIVMDDPVTSLDHAHRTAVAKRLVDESGQRQVIVFTHDAVFYCELITFCEDAGLTPEKKTVRYRAEGPGYVEDGFPHDLRKYAERLKYHRADQKDLEASFHNPPGEDERLAMRNIYDDLRVTLEVGIEDIVLNGTVARFRDNISVGRLDKVMLVQPEEFREVQRLHDKFCRQVRAHAQAAGQQRAVPQPAELLADIDAVAKLFGDINRRR